MITPQQPDPATLVARYEGRAPRYTSYPTAVQFGPQVTAADYAEWIGALDPAAAWKAAHADEDYQMAQWGLDDMALKRREGRFAEFMAAATVLRFVG